MEKVLLAFEGVTPNRKAFSYAMQLCKRIRAELSVLQIIRPRVYGQYFKKVREGTHHAKAYIEGSMVAATFAEVGEHDMARQMSTEALKNIKKLLPSSEKAGVLCHLSTRSGNPDKEIVKYVNSHRDVVLTIYDSAEEKPDESSPWRARGVVTKRLRENLPTPLVIMRG